MKLRVAVPCPGVGRVRRGYERFSTDLAEALHGHADVRVFAGRLPKGLPGATIPCPSRELLSRLGMSDERAYYWEQIFFTLALYPALLEYRPHIIHVSDGVVTNALLRLKRFLPGKPRLLFSNGMSQSPDHYARYDNVHLLGPWQLPAQGTDLIEPRRVFVVPYGVDTSRFQPTMEKNEARKSLKLPPGPLAITLAAHIRAHKGVDYLIEELGHSQASDWSLVWLGQRTEETPGLEALAAKVAPGRVIFRTVDAGQVPAYLAASDLFLFASHQEAFGLALVEAMAAGLPAVVRDIPPFRYIIADESQISPFREKGALLPYLAEARSSELKRERGGRNQRRARELFDWAALVPSYLEMYERALANPV